MPLRMEGPSRYQSAVTGLNELNPWVDSLLVIDNERIRSMYGKLSLKDAFGKADDVLGMATKGIAELITVEFALVRVDFADVNKVMRNSGRAHMSVVSGSGENRALEAAQKALESSLLDDNHIVGAKEILLSFAVKDLNQLTHDDLTIAMEYIQKSASYTDEDGIIHQADIIWGASEKRTLEDDELELVVVATRFEDGDKLQIKTEYVEVDPFNNEQKVDVEEPKPEINKPTQTIPPIEPKTINPQRDRYKSIDLQIVKPAYVRHGASFLDENDNVPTTVFQPVSQRVQEETAPAAGDGSLFQTIE
jgi:cell division protein FtsZ